MQERTWWIHRQGHPSMYDCKGEGARSYTGPHPRAAQINETLHSFIYLWLLGWSKNTLLLWNAKFHCIFYKRRPMPLSRPRSIQFPTFTYYISKIHFNIILPPAPMSPNRSPHLPHALYMWPGSRYGRLITGERAAITHCIGDCVGPESVWTLWRREVSRHCRESNPGKPIHSQQLMYIFNVSVGIITS
jgi:hypothetical protein